MHTIELHWHSLMAGVVMGGMAVLLGWFIDDYLEDVAAKASLRKETLAVIEKDLATNGCIRKKIDSYTITQVQYGIAMVANCAH